MLLTCIFSLRQADATLSFAHGHKGSEIFGQSFVIFLIQSGQLSEFGPIISFLLPGWQTVLNYIKTFALNYP